MVSSVLPSWVLRWVLIRLWTLWPNRLGWSISDPGYSRGFSKAIPLYFLLSLNSWTLCRGVDFTELKTGIDWTELVVKNLMRLDWLPVDVTLGRRFHWTELDWSPLDLSLFKGFWKVNYDEAHAIIYYIYITCSYMCDKCMW